MHRKHAWLAAVLWAASCLFGPGNALASDPGSSFVWTRSAERLPWETLTRALDVERIPAADRQTLVARKQDIRPRLDDPRLTDSERAAALVSLGDLFRDEARLVLEADRTSDWRVSVDITPAWLQLEFALEYYDEAIALRPEILDTDVRFMLTRNLVARRLGQLERGPSSKRWIKMARGTPYMDVARVAVADSAYRDGDLDGARAGFRGIRRGRSPGLSLYADYRRADLLARSEELAKADSLLQAVIEAESVGVFYALLREEALSATADHRAFELGVGEVIRWLSTACRDGDAFCVLQLRYAASESMRRRRLVKEAEWLGTVDDLELLRSDIDFRVKLATFASQDARPADLLSMMLKRCPARDAACHITMVHSLWQYFAGASDARGDWLREYLRVPLMLERPEVQQLVRRYLIAPKAPLEELQAFDALCSEPACRTEVRRHLRMVWSRVGRLHDAAWLHFVEDGIPVPGPDEADLVARRLATERKGPREMIATLRGYCASEAEVQELLQLLVGYYAAIGADLEADWVVAWMRIGELPASELEREALRQALLDGTDGLGAVAVLIRECAGDDGACVGRARASVEGFLRFAGRHGQATIVRALSVTDEVPVSVTVRRALVELMVRGDAIDEALQVIEATCDVEGASCGERARRAFGAWLDATGDTEGASRVRAVDEQPDLGVYAEFLPEFLRLARTAPTGRVAAERVVLLCDGDAACQDSLLDALALWYEAQGRPVDASEVRR